MSDGAHTTKRAALFGGPLRLFVLLGLIGLWVFTPGSGEGSADPAARAPDTGPTSTAVAESPPPGVPGMAQEGEAGAAEGEAGSQEEHGAATEPGHPPEEPGADAAHFFLILISILLTAKVLGEAAERIGQPAVLGELIAGVILGGSMLGIVPTGGEMGELIHLLAEVGVAILLFEIGLETDLKEMFRVGTSSALVAAVGVILPAVGGFAYWYFADPAIGAHPSGTSLIAIAIFVGGTLTATSVGITARVLTDLNLMHTSEARIIIGAAVIDDVLGLVILAVVSGLAAGASVSVLGVSYMLVMAIGFLVVAVIVGNLVAPKLFTLIDRMRVRGVLLVSAFAFALLFAALAFLAGSAMIIGAFAAGIVLSSTNQFDLIVERIEPVADVFTPIFFVSVGAAVNVQLFNPLSDVFSTSVLVVGGLLIVVAIAGKLLAGYSVGWGSSDLNQMGIGIGMVPRGEVGLIFADIGRRGGVLSQEAFSAILIMVIVTTFIAPPLLKLVFARPDERGDEPEPALAPDAGTEPVHG